MNSSLSNNSEYGTAKGAQNMKLKLSALMKKGSNQRGPLSKNALQ